MFPDVPLEALDAVQAGEGKSHWGAKTRCNADDCNLTFTDRCRSFVPGREIVDEERFWSHPYNDPRARGYGAPEIVLATYRWR